MDKIVCVGKNYPDHVKEMGGPAPERPVLFLKPPSTLAIISDGHLALPYPAGLGALHYECEIVIRLQAGGYQLEREEAQGLIGEATIGLDMTLRDVQSGLKQRGHPWEIAKVFPHSAIIGPWIPASDVARMLERPFSFTVDGQERQTGTVAQMTLPIVDCIVHASRHFELCPGDLLFTGTPAGVGKIHPGQTGELRWDTLTGSVRWE